MKTEVISTFAEAEKNAKEFAKVGANRNSLAFKRLSYFRHWFYFDSIDVFAPSKFVGVKGTRINNYTGGVNGTTTNNALFKHFKQVRVNSREFNKLALKLDEFLLDLNKKTNTQVRDPSRGGIHILSFGLRPGNVSSSKNRKKSNDELYREGNTRSVVLSQYERSSAARKACIEHWGLSCYVCGFNFENRYGKLGKGFIHVHHLTELHTKKQKTNPKEDLRPLCPNCHAMVHKKKPAIHPEILRSCHFVKASL